MVQFDLFIEFDKHVYFSTLLCGGYSEDPSQWDETDPMSTQGHVTGDVLLILLNHQPKYVLWVVSGTIPIRRFQWVSKTNVKANVWPFLGIGIYIYILQTFGMSVEMKLSTKMCAVGSQRIRLNDTVPMSALNECWSKCLTNFLESTYIFSGYFDTSVGVKLSTKICVVGSQRNHLNETAQMSTYNKC